MNRKVRLALVGLVVLVVGSFALADGIPTVTPLTYSGVLQNSAGNPVTTAQSMQLTLWDDATANASANQKCVTPTQNVTPDAQGRFQVVLDQACFDAVRANPNLWVQVQVGSVVLPRSKLGAVPYSVESGRALRQVVASSTSRMTTSGLYCGATANVTGSIAAMGGALTGYRAMKLLCEQTCSSSTAHACTAYEAVNSHILGATMPEAYVITPGESFDSRSGGFFRDCNGFTNSAPANRGHSWNPTVGSLGGMPCNESRPVLCCN